MPENACWFFCPRKASRHHGGTAKRKENKTKSHHSARFSHFPDTRSFADPQQVLRHRRADTAVEENDGAKTKTHRQRQSDEPMETGKPWRSSCKDQTDRQE